MKHSSGEQTQPGYSEACERNKNPIFDVLQVVFDKTRRVLEVGSGTGQHAVYFAARLAHITWQPTDQQAYLPSLQARLDLEAPDNVLPARELEVCMRSWPGRNYDALFSANTLHYMSIECVEAFFAGAGRMVEAGGKLAVYGPFNYGGSYTSASNARFDQWLRESDSARAIRDFEWVSKLAAAEQFELIDDISMPANNRMLLWRRGNVA